MNRSCFQENESSVSLLVVFVFIYWFFYILRIALSYADIFISMSIFNLLLTTAAGVLIVIKWKRSQQGIEITIENALLVSLALTVLIAFMPAAISTVEAGLSIGVYFVAVFPVLFLILAILLKKDNETQAFEKAKNIYLMIFILNFIVGSGQAIAVNVGLIDLGFFWFNPSLQAIIFPGFGITEDRLRVPGLFANGGVNGYFNSILLIYLLASWGQRKVTKAQLILVVMAVVSIYLCYTRKVWLSLIIVGIAFIVLEIIVSKSQQKKIVYSVSIFFVSLALIVGLVLASESVDSVQAFNLESSFERFGSWTYFFNMFANSSLFYKIFGFGLLQAFMGDFTSFQSVLIDNALMAIVLYAGLLGLFVYVLFWLFLGLLMWRRYREYKFGFLIWLFFTFVSLYSTFFADISNIMFAMSVFALVLTQGRSVQTRV